jgi:hypothetical protein
MEIIGNQNKNILVLHIYKNDLENTIDILIDLNDHPEKRKDLLKLLRREDIVYHYVSNKKEISDNSLIILSCGKDVEYIRSTISMIFEEIFKERMDWFDFTFGNIEKKNNSNNICSFKYRMPVLAIDWVLGKLKLKKVDFSYKEDRLPERKYE